MSSEAFKSEIRASDIRSLIEKTRKQSYGSYLHSLRLERIRQFRGAEITFDFPVTALIGPNGSGKSTILGASACVYTSFQPKSVFIKSHVGDTGMNNWKIEYEVIDKALNPKGTLRAEVKFINNQWHRQSEFDRNVKAFGISRTLSMNENREFIYKNWLIEGKPLKYTEVSHKEVSGIDFIKREAEHILGKSLAEFKLIEVNFSTTRTRMRRQHVFSREVLQDGTEITTTKRKGEHAPVTITTLRRQIILQGHNGKESYSEFNFGSGEASVIRMVAEIEVLPSNSLVLIEEIENGLHPLAVRRLVEYLIDVAKRNSIQVIFTTHSDYALAPLPSEAIWASIDGQLQQGKLSVEALRAVSGRVDKRLAIFVEDEFAQSWVEAILRDKLSDHLDEIGVYPVHGDGNAVKIHFGHAMNPAIPFHSVCIIDGDSPQKEDADNRVFRLPGTPEMMPEQTVFDAVVSNLGTNIAMLTLACQISLGKQSKVQEVIQNVSHTNRDAHLLFSQVGERLGLLPTATIRGAFFTLWIQENSDEADRIAAAVRRALELPRKEEMSRKPASKA